MSLPFPVGAFIMAFATLVVAMRGSMGDENGAELWEGLGAMVLGFF